MAAYYLWCDRYTGENDQNQQGCTFVNTEPENNGERYVGETGWGARYHDQDRLHNELRCTVHNRKPRVFRRQSAYDNRIRTAWRKVWDDTRVWIGPEPWRTRANIVRRRPTPPTIRSTWNTATLR